MAHATSKLSNSTLCGECGVALPPNTRRCWLCNQVLVARPAGRRSGAYLAPSALRFQLHSLFLSIGLISFCLAVARHWPQLAMALVVPLVTAYLRTLQISLDHAQVGRPLNGRAKILWYIRSLGVAFLILTGAVSALIVSIGLGAAVGYGASEWREEPIYILVGFAIGTSFGVFGALALAGWTGHRFWPGPVVRRIEAE